MIDADLQDPPEAIPQLVKKWQEGFDVVYGVRIERQGDSWFKKTTAFLYYRLMKKLSRIDMPLDTGDFRLLSRSFVEALKPMKEKSPFLRGLISWMGFRQVGIPVKRETRFAGVTKHPLSKMLQFAWSGVAHFSFFPLQIATWIGVVTLFLCVIEILHALYVSLVLKSTVPGWAPLMIAVLFLGSAQLITAGILGSYLARNYDESRNRPLYLIQKKEGF
jgi:polyisoprenyl-phosphate glycosyltransferase